jgi:hypothetical protein
MPQNDASRFRSALADRVCDRFASLPLFCAGILTGSAAIGLSDNESDVDVALFYDSVPPAASLDTARLGLGGERLLFSSGDPAEGSFVHSFLLEGIKTDVAHMSLDKWREDAADVLVRFNPDSPMQKALQGLMDSVAMRGPVVIDGLRNEARYPDGLAHAVVTANLRFFPPWALQGQAADRGDALYFYQMLTGETARLIHVLCGLNRIYHWGDLKHSRRLLEQMHAAPPGIQDSIPNLFGGDMRGAARLLDELIRATFEIVEREMPKVDLARARARYATPGRG